MLAKQVPERSCREDARNDAGNVARGGRDALVDGDWPECAGRALRSAGAELNAQIMGLCEGLAVASLCLEWGFEVVIESLCDSSAARCIASLVRSGKLKHLQARQSGLKTWSGQGGTRTKVPRLVKSADALTHDCSEKVLK